MTQSIQRDLLCTEMLGRRSLCFEMHGVLDRQAPTMSCSRSWSMQAMRQFGELLDLHLLVVSSGEVGLCVKTISGKHPLVDPIHPGIGTSRRWNLRLWTFGRL